ncbi:hypothetical protein ACFQZE_06400 [Paenibacillus sp. GCM10027627]|uniref:hypothetical protein n=1 Tax=unclassified Paenibacillus TaxID=185978 RepID=UPI00363D5AFF
MTKELILAGGEICLVDDEDYDYLNQWTWREDCGYAVRITTVNGERMKIRMHRILMNCPDDLEVDHKQRKRLDNRKERLRICTSQENSFNVGKVNPEDATSIYKGVSKRERVGETGWRMRVTRDDYSTYVDMNFNNEIAAANAYNYFAIKLHGEFAVLNDCPFMAMELWETFKTSKKKAEINSKYIGVGWNKKRRKWRAYAFKDGKQVHIGYFETELEAAETYNKKCTELGFPIEKLNIITK